MACVYLIKEQETGQYKIGVARTPIGRLYSLQTGNPRQLDIVAALECGSRAYEIESALHERYVTLSVRGEWFSMSDSDARDLSWWFSTLTGVPDTNRKEITHQKPSLQNQVLDRVERMGFWSRLRWLIHGDNRIQIPDVIEFEGRTWRRDLHPTWYFVLDWSMCNQDKNGWGAKRVMRETGVSKPYVISARRWWKENCT